MICYKEMNTSFSAILVSTQHWKLFTGIWNAQGDKGKLIAGLIDVEALAGISTTTLEHLNTENGSL